MRVALVTCRVLPEPDPDQNLLLEALTAAGMSPVLLPWNDPKADASAYDLCVLRSCWNYHEAPASFLAWLDRTASQTCVLNPAHIVTWNHHKRYLCELSSHGIPIVPTVHVAAGSQASLLEIVETQSWNDVVIKPAISAASFRTARFVYDSLADGARYLADLNSTHDVLVQEYMYSVETDLERAIVCIDGRVMHAVQKRPRFADADECVSNAQTVTDEERAFAHTVLGCLSDRLLYARVDIMRDGRGNICLSELELIEPSLFLKQSQAALSALVQAIAREAKAVVRGRHCHH